MLCDLFRETLEVTCARCGDEVPYSSMVSIDGHLVCQDCEQDYCNERAGRGDYEDFIRTDPRREAEFFLHYWWDELPQEIKLEYARRTYHAARISETFPELERDFCKQDGDWFPFMKGRLAG